MDNTLHLCTRCGAGPDVTDGDGERLKALFGEVSSDGRSLDFRRDTDVSAHTLEYKTLLCYVVYTAIVCLFTIIL